MVESRQLIVVRRGEADLFRVLQERFGSEPGRPPVIWDRRIRDRRVIIRDDVSTERRRCERRAPEPSTWTTHGFLITRPRPDAPPPSRSRSRAPVATGRAQALIESATRLGPETAVAGCARCQACSSLNLVQKADHPSPCAPGGGAAPLLLQIGPRPA